MPGTKGLVNFGWDVFEGSTSFEDKPLGPGKLIGPVAEYGHDKGCSVTGGYVYRGRAVPSLRGRYLYGDYCTGTIWSIAAGGGAARVEPFTVRRAELVRRVAGRRAVRGLARRHSVRLAR